MSQSTQLPLRGSPLGSPEDVANTGRAVQTLFAGVAPRYDFLNHFLSLGLDLVWRRNTARALQSLLANTDTVVLDVCCGTGDLALALSRVSNGLVIASDFCHPMLRRASTKAARTRHPVWFFEADTLQLPFPDRSADAITTAFGFRNLANYQRGLMEMIRVLRPGGAVAILEFSRVRWPLFGPLFRYYFANWLPRLGSWISGVSGAYEYLHDSVKHFPDQEGLAAMMREAGLVEVTYRNFMGGVTALHVGYRPMPS
jgi:demethylmenaquinone methyltransferase/2-methoxy-6-polyprenyl-1,4-benzoquinol methylase